MAWPRSPAPTRTYPHAINLENVLQLIDQIGNVETGSLFAKFSKLRQVFANLGGGDPQFFPNSLEEVVVSPADNMRSNACK